VQVDVDLMLESNHKREGPDVELPPFEKEGLGDVLLDEELAAVLPLLFNVLLDLLISSEDAVGGHSLCRVELLHHPVLFVDAHVPAIDPTYLQSFKVGLREGLPLIVHQPTHVEGGEDDVRDCMALLLAVIL
jgi:hypothetical protein